MSAKVPELDLLSTVLGERVARQVARAPGGWRTLHARELVSLGLPEPTQRRVQALQELTSRGFPVVERQQMASFLDVARIYGARLGGLRHEVVLALALDARHRVIEELELARGGAHGAALVPADVFRPLIRVGASALLLVHNHPSGDPTPSSEDIHLTEAVASIGDLIGIPLLDHVVVGAEAAGSVSMRDLGLIHEPGEHL